MPTDQDRNPLSSRIWDRQRQRPAAPIAGLVMSVLAIFGALVGGLAIREGSIAAAGARIDGWLDMIANLVR